MNRDCFKNLKEDYPKFKTFKDLVFEKHDFHKLADAMGKSYPSYEANKTCYQAKMQFLNGLNISVLIGTPFYSNGVDTYEVCLWTDDLEIVIEHQKSGNVSNLMKYAQMISDVRFLELLQQEGFEYMSLFSFIKCIGKWHVLVNPVGISYFAYNTEPANFDSSNFIYCSYERFSEVFPKVEDYIKERELKKFELTSK